jgi:hypothetical protein
MENEFQMFMMGELTFFLGIQVKQMKECIFIHQAKYTKDLIKKFNMTELKPVSTPRSTAAALDPDENGEATDQREYRSMISFLIYLTVIRPLCTLSDFPTLFTLDGSSTNFRYLKHTSKFEIWYSALSSLDLVGFSDADFTGCRIDQKSTSVTCHFLRSSLVCWSAHKQSSVIQSTTEVEYVAVTPRYFG